MDRRAHTTGDLVMALARRVRRAHVDALAAWRRHAVAGPGAAGDRRSTTTAMRPSVLAEQLRIAPAVGDRGGRRARGARLGAPRRPTPTDRRATALTPDRGGRELVAAIDDVRRRAVRAGAGRAAGRPASYAPRDPDRRRGGGPVTVRVGLTGGVASGKSTVSAILAELGAVVIDADLHRARGGGARHRRGSTAVVAEFGPELLTPDGDLDRPAMGALVFADPDGAASGSRRSSTRSSTRRSAELEAAAPATTRSSSTTSRCSPRSGGPASFDAVVVVDVPAELQVARMVEDRGWTPRGRRVPDRRAGDARGPAGDRDVRRRQHRDASTSCARGSRRSTPTLARAGLTFPGRRGRGR